MDSLPSLNGFLFGFPGIKPLVIWCKASVRKTLSTPINILSSLSDIILDDAKIAVLTLESELRLSGFLGSK